MKGQTLSLIETNQARKKETEKDYDGRRGKPTDRQEDIQGDSQRQTQSARERDIESDTEIWSNGTIFFTCTPTDKYMEGQTDKLA